ncbi:MAG: flippase [Pirellulaceae bacterium]|nr:flippase [Planctomycetales bacterium]
MSSVRGRVAKIKRNAIALLGGDVANRASTFAVYAMLAPYGLREFGQLSYGLTLLYTFHVFAAAGLPTSVTRAVARNPRRARRVLYHGYVAAAIPSLVSAGCMSLFALVMGYPVDTVVVIALLSLAIIPYAMTMITEAVIRGREDMHLIALANIPGNAAMLGAAYVTLKLGYSVWGLAIVIVLSRLLTLLVVHCLFSWSCRDSRHVRRIRWRFAWGLLRRSMVFLGSDSVNVIWASLDMVILSKFATEREIGLLGSSFQMLQPILVLYRCIGVSSFPALCDAAVRGGQHIGELSQTLIRFLLRLGVPATVAVYLLAPDVLTTVYRNEDFGSGAFVLQTLAFTLLLDPLNPVLGHALWAMSRETIVLRIVIVNLIVNACVGFVLISQFGLAGAAGSVVVSSVTNLAQHYYFFRTEVYPLRLWRELIKLLPATIALLGCVALGWGSTYCASSMQSVADAIGRVVPVTCRGSYVALAIGLIAYAILAFPATWADRLPRTFSRALRA